MKSILLLFTFLITTLTIQAQELFSDAFQNTLPFSLVVVDEEVYVGIFSANSEYDLGIYKMPISDPTDISLVAEIPSQSVGPLDLIYDTAQNVLIASISNQIIRVDLDQSLPVTAEVLYDNPYSINNGLALNDDFVFFVDQENILHKQIDTTFDAEIFYSTAFGNQISIAGIFNSYLFYFDRNIETAAIELYKISVNETDAIPILVSSMTNFSGFPQGIYIKGNVLYAALEVSGEADPLLKINLSQSTPVDPEVILNGNDGTTALGIGSNALDLYFTDGNTQNIFTLEEDSLNVNQFTQETGVYPNPSNNLVFVSSNFTDSINYSIVNTSGQIILQNTYNNNIDVSTLSSGMYFLTLNSAKNDYKKVYKFIKR